LEPRILSPATRTAKGEMIMVFVDVQANDTGAITALNLAIDNFKDIPRKLEQVKKLMVGSVKRNFTAGGRPSPWPPVTQTTIELRKSNHSSKRGTDTGALKNSITGFIFGNTLTITAGAGMSGGGFATTPYAAYQQLGFHQFIFGRDTGRETPAMPFMVFQDSDILNIVKIFSSGKKDVGDIQWGAE